MATATRKSPAAIKLAGRAAHTPLRELMEFVIFEDNGGSYRWRIDAGTSGVTGPCSEFFTATALR